MKRTILLVFGDANVARELARHLTTERSWEVRAVPSAMEALVVLSQWPASAIVADQKLRGAEGAMLLDEVMRRCPDTRRLVTVDLKDRTAVLQCVGRAHQMMARPVDPRSLEAALDRAFRSELWLASPSLRDLIARLTKLPSPPQAFFQMVKELQSPHASIEGIGALLTRDVAISAKLLQLVNSAAFGLAQPATTATDAVLLLGIETTKALVLLAHCFSYFEGLDRKNFSSEELWKHSIGTGQFARAIARAEGCDLEQIDMCYTAGLLHDIGKLALAANLPTEFGQAMERARQENIPIREAESRVFQANHAEVGAALLASWGLDPDIVEAVALHASPVRFQNPGFCPLTSVHVGSAFDHALRQGHTPLIDEPYLQQLELWDRLPAWRERCLELVVEEHAATRAA